VRYLVPNRSSFREAWQLTLCDLSLGKPCLCSRKYNGAQQIAYRAVILMGAGSLLTGLAIYRPTQAHLLTSVLGYETARWHFWLTMGYCVFLVIPPRWRAPTGTGKMANGTGRGIGGIFHHHYKTPTAPALSEPQD
jgi:hypothetical protein